MEKILGEKIFDSLYESFKSQLIEFKENDKDQIKSKNTEEYTAKVEELEEIYALYDEKLAFIKKICDKNNQTKIRFLSIIKRIHDIGQRTDRQKILISLSYAVLVDYFKRIHERTDEEIIMLASCSTGLDLEDYTYYIGILSNEDVSRAITKKTGNMKEQVNIAYDIMDSQDEFDYDFITSDNYEILVNNGLNVVNSYEISEQEENNDFIANVKLVCPDCGEEFEFPTTITAYDLFLQGIDFKEAQQLLAARDLAKSNLVTITDEDEKRNVENNYIKLEKMIIAYSNGFSKEAYEFYGFPELPRRCFDCKRKAKEAARNRADNINNRHR